MGKKRKIKDVDGYLSRRYYDVTKPAAFTSMSKLFGEIKKEGNPHNISFDRVKQWGRRQDAITLNPSRIWKKKPRRRVITGLRNTMYDVDLLQLNQERFKKANNSVGFLLVCIDVFSRYARVAPLKTKNAADVLEGFKKILPKTGTENLNLRCDNGKEFDNALVKTYMKDRSINLYFTNSSTKSNYSETLVKGIKRRIFRIFQHQGSYRYIDKLDDIIRSYNSTIHSSISMAPKDVNSTNEQEIWDRLYFPPKAYKDEFKAALSRGRQRRKERSKAFEHGIGDTVRISYLRQPFSRDYDNAYSGEIFRIRDRRRDQGINVYYLRDYSGEDIKGAFYNFELNKVTHDPKGRFKVEKIIKTRHRNGKSESLVRFLGYGPKNDEWIETSKIKSIGRRQK